MDVDEEEEGPIEISSDNDTPVQAPEAVPVPPDPRPLVLFISDDDDGDGDTNTSMTLASQLSIEDIAAEVHAAVEILIRDRPVLVRPTARELETSERHHSERIDVVTSIASGGRTLVIESLRMGDLAARGGPMYFFTALCQAMLSGRLGFDRLVVLRSALADAGAGANLFGRLFYWHPSDLGDAFEFHLPTLASHRHRALEHYFQAGPNRRLGDTLTIHGITFCLDEYYAWTPEYRDRMENQQAQDPSFDPDLDPGSQFRRPPHDADRFKRFYRRVSEHCKGLGNFELLQPEPWASLECVFVDAIAPTTPGASVVQVLAYLRAVCRIRCCPLFVRRNVYEARLKGAAMGLDDTVPVFQLLGDEEYVCWLPQRRAIGQGGNHENVRQVYDDEDANADILDDEDDEKGAKRGREEEEEDDGGGQQKKRTRFEFPVRPCAYCRISSPMMRTAFLHFCGTACHQHYFLGEAK